jgi:hypothetical protein
MLRLRPGMPSWKIDGTTRFLMSETGCDNSFSTALQNSNQGRLLIPSSMGAILAHRPGSYIQKIIMGRYFA